MKVISITVNFSTPRLALKAAESALEDIHRLRGRVIIVDNDSPDSSYERISRDVQSRSWEDYVKVVKTPNNCGFGCGVNFAIKAAANDDTKPEYFYLLGPDATIKPGSLIELVRFMDANPGVGLGGSKTYNADGSVRTSAFRFPSILSEIESGLRLGIVSRLLSRWTVRLPVPNVTKAVDWVSAASLIIRRKALEQVGSFDEKFFLYFEETDLCKRFSDAGWATYFVAESVATHVGQASTGLHDITRPRPRYWFESRRRYFVKHHGAAGLWCSNLAYMLCHSLWRARRKLQGKPETDPPRLLSDFIRHSF